MSADKPIKLPKTLAACADLLYNTRVARYELAKQLDAMKATEAALTERLIQELPKSSATGVAGKAARVSVVLKTVVKTDDFDAVLAYVVKNYKKNPGTAALIQRRVGDAAVREMWNAGKEVPGVSPMDVPVLSVNKVA